MKCSSVLALGIFLFAVNVSSADDWKYIGNTSNGLRIYSVSAERMNDNSLRTFLRAERDLEKPPEGLFSIFQKPEKYTEKSEPFAVLVHCKKRAVRDYKAGDFGSEFYIPWEPLAPGSIGMLVFNAFCSK